MMIRIHWNNNCDKVIDRLHLSLAEANVARDQARERADFMEAKTTLKHNQDMAREDRVTQLLQEIEHLKDIREVDKRSSTIERSEKMQKLMGINAALQECIVKAQKEINAYNHTIEQKNKHINLTTTNYKNEQDVHALLRVNYTNLQAAVRKLTDDYNARGQKIYQLQEDIREMKACIPAGFTMTKSGLLAREYDQSMSMPVKPEQLKILNELTTPDKKDFSLLTGAAHEQAIKVLRNRTTNKNKMRPRVEIMKEKIAQLEHWQKHGKRPYVKKNIAFWKGIKSTPTYHNIKYNGVKV